MVEPPTSPLSRYAGSAAPATAGAVSPGFFHASGVPGAIIRAMVAANRLLVGQIALELGFVTKEQLQECIELQAGQPQAKPIGTLLVETGMLSAERLAAVMDEQ